jgi:hypothetical protein
MAVAYRARYDSLGMKLLATILVMGFLILLLRLEGIRTKRLTMAATARLAKLPANAVKRT